MFRKLEFDTITITYFGGTFFLAATIGSTVLLLSEDWEDSSDFLEALSATFSPFTSMTVTKSPACDAGRVLAGVGLVCSTATGYNYDDIMSCIKFPLTILNNGLLFVT